MKSNKLLFYLRTYTIFIMSVRVLSSKLCISKISVYFLLFLSNSENTVVQILSYYYEIGSWYYWLSIFSLYLIFYLALLFCIYFIFLSCYIFMCSYTSTPSLKVFFNLLIDYLYIYFFGGDADFFVFFVLSGESKLILTFLGSGEFFILSIYVP